MRDSQRQRVYDAEFRLRGLYDTADVIGSRVVELDGVTLTLPPEAKFGCLDSLQRYVDAVTGAVGEVRVRDRRTAHHAHYEAAGRTIAIPDRRVGWAMRELVVLHELAHHYTRTEHSGVAAHGPEFVNTFADLLARTMGPEVGLAYRILCAHAGVKERCDT